MDIVGIEGFGTACETEAVKEMVSFYKIGLSKAGGACDYGNRLGNSARMFCAKIGKVLPSHILVTYHLLRPPSQANEAITEMPWISMSAIKDAHFETRFYQLGYFLVDEVVGIDWERPANSYHNPRPGAGFPKTQTTMQSEYRQLPPMRQIRACPASKYGRNSIFHGVDTSELSRLSPQLNPIACVYRFVAIFSSKLPDRLGSR